MKILTCSKDRELNCDHNWGTDTTTRLKPNFDAKPRSQLRKASIQLLPDHRNTQTFFFGTSKALALSLSARACQDWATWCFTQLCQSRLSPRACVPSPAEHHLQAREWPQRRFGYLQQPSTHNVQPRKQSGPPPCFLLPAWPSYHAGPVQLPALNCCFSAGEAKRNVHLAGHHERRHKSRVLLCCSWQDVPLPSSPDCLCPLYQLLGTGSSWRLQHRQV